MLFLIFKFQKCFKEIQFLRKKFMSEKNYWLCGATWGNDDLRKKFVEQDVWILGWEGDNKQFIPNKVLTLNLLFKRIRV